MAIRSPRTSMLLGSLAMLFIGLSLALKLISLREFGFSVAGWRLIPRDFVPAIVILTPTFEAALVTAWCAGWHRRAALLCACVLIVTVTIFYLAQGVALKSWPSCGCLGQVAADREWADRAIALFIRNGILVAILGVALWRWPRVDDVGEPDTLGTLDPKISLSSSSTRAGFTLVELLVCLVVVSILLGLLAAGLAKSRGYGVQSVSSANLRSNAQLFSLYASDYEGIFPYLTNPQSELSRVSCSEAWIYMRYFTIYGHWHLVIAEQYADSSPRAAVFFPPGSPTGYATGYWYSSTFLAAPEFWAAASRTGPEQWRPTRDSDVRYPAQKGLLMDSPALINAAASPTREVPIGFVDGSSQAAKYSVLTAPYPGGDGDWPGSEFLPPLPIMHTIDGVRGRDLRR